MINNKNCIKSCPKAKCIQNWTCLLSMCCMFKISTCRWFHIADITPKQELTIVKSLTPHFKFIPFDLSSFSNDAATLQINKVTRMVRALMKTCCFAQQLNWCVKLYNNLQLNDLKRYSPNDRYGFFCI